MLCRSSRGRGGGGAGEEERGRGEGKGEGTKEVARAVTVKSFVPLTPELTITFCSMFDHTYCINTLLWLCTRIYNMHMVPVFIQYVVRGYLSTVL
jgi:hypothetical protein